MVVFALIAAVAFEVWGLPMFSKHASASADVTNGLVGYYKLDESTGTIAYDSSGYGFNGTVPCACDWSPTGGKINGAFFTYSNDYVTIPSNSLNNFSGDFSITLWVQPSSGATLLWKNIPSAPAFASMIQGYRLSLLGKTMFMYLDGTYKTSNLQLTSGWNNIAIVKSGGTLTFYVNGVADTPMAVPTTITPTNSPLYLSAGGGGSLDEVRLYDRALSGSEVQTIMNSDGSYVGPPQTPPPTISSFTASSSSAPGQSAALSWSVSGATSVSIDNGLGQQSNVTNGTATVSPSVTTSYTLTASNSGGTETSLATVVVQQPAPTYATNLVITSPAANAVISGNMNLGVSVNNIPGIASVEYFYDNRPLTDLSTTNPVGPLPSPYTYTWNSNNEWDGYGYLTAEALDSSGNVLSTSAPVNIQIANSGYTLQQTSPLAGQTVSGVISWATTPGSNTPAGVTSICTVDGARSQTINGSVSFDTTQLENGTHDFHCILASPSGVLPLAMSSVQVTVDNGHTPMELQANFNTLYLTPGQSQNLTAYMTYTDDTQSQISATYSVDNSSVVTVNSNGTVTAVGDGTATVTVIGGGKSDAVQVIVNASHAFPQFSKSGQLLTSYQPGNSIFMKSIFQGPGFDDFEFDPKLAGEVVGAGVNTIENALYNSPTYTSGYSTANDYASQSGTLAAFEGFLDYNNANTMSYLVGDNFSTMLFGDDAIASPADMEDTIFDPYSAAKFEYSLQYWADSGRAVGVAMKDEVDSAWGCYPFDTTAGYWNKWSTSFTTSPFFALQSMIDSVPHPPISWPTIGIGVPVCLGNWQGNPSFADFTNLYWDGGGWFYPDGESIYGNRVNVFNNKLWASLPYMQTNKPLVTEVSFTGLAFNKNVTSPSFIPGVDTLDRSGNTPQEINVQIFMGIAKGSAGVRLFSWAPEYDTVSNIPAGEDFAFEGTSPYFGVDRWNAMSAAFNLEQVLEPYVLSPMANALDLGPYVETGAKSGSYGNMLIAINDLDNTQMISPNLSAYTTGGSVTRYRLDDSRVTSQNLGNVTSDQVMLQPGEVVVYLFPANGNSAPAAPVITPANPSSYGATPISVKFTTPAAKSNVSGTIPIAATITDTAGAITSVQFMVDGVQIGSTLTAPPYQVSWNTALSVPVLSYDYITALVKDNAGNQYAANANMDSVTVIGAGGVATSTPPSDITPPTASISSPLANATLSGSASAISVSASDNIGVTKVELYVDGSLAGTDTSAPYAFSLNTTVYSNGSHTLSAKAYDAAGNIGTAPSVAVTISNASGSTSTPAFGFTSVSVNSITETSAQVNVTMTKAASVVVKYGPTILYPFATLASPNLTSTFFNITNLIPGTGYDFEATAIPEGSTTAYTSPNYTFTTLTVSLPSNPASPSTGGNGSGGGGAVTPLPPTATSTKLGTTGSSPPTSGATASLSILPIFPRNLAYGDTGSDVTLLQTVMKNLGFFNATTTITATFGQFTQHAVLLFQNAHDLNKSGFLDTPTQTLLDKVVSANPALGGSALKPVTAPVATSTPAATVTPPTTSSTSFTKNLAPGSSGSEVTLLQQTLFTDGDYPADIVTGYYGALTEQAVKVFQAKYGIVDYGSPATTGYGAVGPKTRETLGGV